MKNNKLMILLAIASLTSTLYAQSNPPVRYKVIQVAAPAGELTNAQSSDVNDNCFVSINRMQFAVNTSSGYVFRPRMWVPSFSPFGGSVDALSAPSGDTAEQSEGWVNAINNTNEAVGWWKTWAGGNQYLPTKNVRWSGSNVLSTIETDPGINGLAMPTQNDINDSGIICGTTPLAGQEGIPGGWRAYTTTAPNYEKTIFTSFPANMVHALASGINGDGDVAGYVIRQVDQTQYVRGVLWTAQNAHEEVCPINDLTHTRLEKYHEAGYGVGYAWKVVNSQISGQRGFRWTSACEMELLPVGMEWPKDINAQGWIVGSTGVVPPKNWPTTGYSLYSLLSSASGNALDDAARTAQWQIEPLAINKSGCIAGTGKKGGNANISYAVLLVPTFPEATTTINIPIKFDRWKTTNPATNVSIRYRLQIGAMVVRAEETATVTIPANSDTGTLTISSEFRGDLVIRVKGPKWLGKKISISTSTTSNSATTAPTTLILGGDANDDNYVTTDDYLILNNSFDKSVGEAGYDDRADFDGDKSVTTDDYLILSDNFDLSGEA